MDAEKQSKCRWNHVRVHSDRLCLLNVSGDHEETLEDAQCVLSARMWILMTLTKAPRKFDGSECIITAILIFAFFREIWSHFAFHLSLRISWKLQHQATDWQHWQALVRPIDWEVAWVFVRFESAEIHHYLLDAGWCKEKALWNVCRHSDNGISKPLFDRSWLHQCLCVSCSQIHSILKSAVI